jgi:hypothetical protein
MHNHEVYKIYRDTYSGKAESRPEFNWDDKMNKIDRIEKIEEELKQLKKEEW